MATDYNIFLVPDTGGGTGCMVECYYSVYTPVWKVYVQGYVHVLCAAHTCTLYVQSLYFNLCL